MEVLPRYKELLSQYKYEKFPSIEPIEELYLTLLVEGNSVQDVSRLTGTSVSMVRTRLNRLKLRANATSYIQLVIKYLICPHIVV